MDQVVRAVRPRVVVGIVIFFLIGLQIQASAALLAGRQAGVVAKLHGSATVARPAVTIPVNLRFKDPVFLGDTVAVGENSVARLLLEGRALVTLRELSVFRVTEELDRAIIDLSIGKLSLAVLRKKMAAGDLIEVRTANAIAAVRGTVLIAEFEPAISKPGSSKPSEPTTTFSLLKGTVTVFCGAPPSGTAPEAGGSGGDTVVIGQHEQVTVTGSACGPVKRLSAADIARLLDGLESPLDADASSADANSRTAQLELDKALALASYLAPGSVAPRPSPNSQPSGETVPSPDTQVPPAGGIGTGNPPIPGDSPSDSRPAASGSSGQTPQTGTGSSNGLPASDPQLIAASQGLSQGDADTAASNSSLPIPTQGLQFPIVSTTQQTGGLPAGGLGGGPGGGTGGGSGGGPGGGGGGTSTGSMTPIVINGGTTTLGPSQTVGSFPGNQTNTGTNPLVQINNGTVTQNPSGTIVQFPTGSTVTTGGAASGVTNGTITAPGSTLVDVNGSLTSTTGPVITLTNTNTNVGTILDVGPNGQSASSGPILNQNGGTTTVNQGGILVQDNSQVTGGQLVNITNGTMTVNNGPLVGATNNSTVTTTSTLPAIQITDGSLNLGPGASGLSITNNSTATLGGPAVGVTNGTLNGANNTLVNVQQSTLTGNSGPLVDVTTTNTNIGTILNVGPNGHVTVAGPIFNQNGGTTTANQGGMLVHDNSTLTGGQFVNNTNGTMTVNNGPLVGATNNSTVTTTSTAPAIQTTGGSLTLGPGSSGLSITDHSNANLAGPVIGTNGTAVTTNGGHLVTVSDNSSLTSPSTSPAIQMTGGSLTLGTGSSALSVADHSTVTVGGPVFQAIGTTLNTAGSHAPLIDVRGGSSLIAGGRLVDIRNTSLSLPGQPVVLVADGSRLTTTAGPAFCVIDGALTADALLQSTGTPANQINLRGPLLHLERASAQLGQLLNVTGQNAVPTITLGVGEPVVTMKDSRLTLTEDGAPLIALGGTTPHTQTGVSLIADNSTISTKGPILAFQNITYTDPNPQLQLTNSRTTVTGTSSLVEVSTGLSSLAGPLFKAVGGAITVTNPNFRPGGGDDEGEGEEEGKEGKEGKEEHEDHRPGNSSKPGGGLLEIKPGASLEHKGTTALIMTNGTNLTLDQGLIKVDRGELATKSTQALAMITGGTHAIATVPGSALVELHGSSTDNQGLGTDQPLHGGKPGTPAALVAALVEATGATITTESAVKVDRALLNATKPLLELKGTSQITTNGSAITLTKGGQIVETGDYLVGLDFSRFTVKNGSFLELVGTNKVSVQGDLVVLRNGSLMTIASPTNGFLISASGASVVEILGSLIRFEGTGGNAIRVANTLAPTKVINGIPVRLTGGATASQVIIEGTAIENPALGKITNLEGGTFKGSLIAIDGTQAKVTIRGR